MSTPTSPIGQLSGPVVLTGVVPGYAVIPSPTPLTFLNYYDGKFLQASDLRQEQLAMQSMIELSNQAAGTPGPSYGFDITLGSGDMLTLGPGLATDQQGRVLYLPQSVDVAVSDLLASMQVPGGSGTASAAASGAASSATSAAFQPCDLAVSPPSATLVAGTELYLVTLAAAEGLCGTDEVFGQLCEAACVTASDRPWRIEGVLLGLVPLTLGQLVTSSSVVLTGTHLRSRVASAYFAAETAAAGSLISAAGLAASAWCLGATALAGSGHPARHPGPFRRIHRLPGRMGGAAGAHRDLPAALLGRADGDAAVERVPGPGAPVPVPAVGGAEPRRHRRPRHESARPGHDAARAVRRAHRRTADGAARSRAARSGARSADPGGGPGRSSNRREHPGAGHRGLPPGGDRRPGRKDHPVEPRADRRRHSRTARQPATCRSTSAPGSRSRRRCTRCSGQASTCVSA